MDPAVVGARVASAAVAPLIKKLFVREGPGAGLLDRPVRLSGLLSFTGEKRTLIERDLRKLAAELVRRAVAAGERPVPEDEEEAVADALARSLHALGDLAMDDVQAVRLGHTHLARELHRTAGRPDRLLSADAAGLYERLLDTACLHVLHFFTQRSSFVARSAVEQARGQAELIAKTDELLLRVPRPDGRDTAFEERYAAYVAEKHGTLTIVGIDLHHTEAAWPLDTAYLSLELQERDPSSPRPSGHDDWVPFDTNRPDSPHGFPVPEYGDDWAPPALEAPATPLPADRIFSGRDRVLLRGAAGSGKTTLVQWLAVSTARGELPEDMAELRGRVPFVLPLRSVIRAGTLPLPDAFLSAAHNPLHAAQPEGWADRVLRARRGLLLVDGLDEIPERERERARRWLADLLTAYPGNLWLVTSRPSAVGDGWLAAQGFAELALAPMSGKDVAAFVDRWHDAAKAGCRTSGHNADRAAELDRFRTALHTAVRTKRDLGRLVTNPLMCAMVCALHRARNGYLPPGRKELYEEALRMLLSRRDVERDIPAPDDIQLTEEPQIQLLQRLAYWLIRNGRTELDREHAERMIADALPSVPAAARQGDAPRVFRHLLLRSGLLREPTDGTVDFVHRTFQDYLGAKAAVEEWDIGLLIRNAADAQWEDVIRMAVAHARPRERAEILKELLTSADAARGPARVRIRLLALACLEHAAELDPAVRAAVKKRTAALIPPRGIREARYLAEAGPLVLELLPGPDGLEDNEALSVVTAASHVKSEAAVDFLARFRSHPALLVRSQLAWSWQRFDLRRYADEVIAHLDSDGLYFTAPTPDHLRALLDLGGRPMLEIRNPETASRLPGYARRTALTHLTLRYGRSPIHLGLFQGLDSLESLRLTNIHPAHLTGLSHLHLKHLSLTDVLGKDLATLRRLTTLNSLELGLLDGEWALADLPADAPLESLLLSRLMGPGPRGGLRGIGRWQTLRRLRLGLRSSPRSSAEWAEVGRIPGLRDLTVSSGSLEHCGPGLALPVEHLSISADSSPGPGTDKGHLPDMSVIARNFPCLRRLQLVLESEAGGGADLAPLAALPHLEVVALSLLTRVRGADRLPESVHIVRHG
ncbi:NACHT domain-containing protein [Streptomyces xinghaiensis]|uniref:NACHT domain-containing protein n=1 Tax=Streptomyces xinghaiensis TaxID=1038928 RepID=UPI0002E775BD|nr:NACHT domain-containing protein [Streptomyces xinghaiensis]MZE79030.1 NACHT domain-containing protein [Streptomyces sp. SID5475]